MLHKTGGIVLSYIKYRDSSVIVKVYTELFGLQSYIINGIRSKSSKKSLALLQPLTLLDMVVYKKSNHNKGINRLSEYRSAFIFKSIPFDVKKSTIAIFISEWMSKIIFEEDMIDSRQFSFFREAITRFDNLKEGFQNFHLQLLIKTTDFLGFGIHSMDDMTSSFDKFPTDMTIQWDMIKRLYNDDFGSNLEMSSRSRRDILDLMIRYYQLHIEGFTDVKSLGVLKEVFRDGES